MLDSSDHQFVVSQLQPAIHGLTAVHTFSFHGMKGGLWPQLLDTVAAAPALTHLIIDHMPWFGLVWDVFDFPLTLLLPPLRRFAYNAPHTVNENNYRPRKMKRPPHMLESEVHNLRAVLRACHSSLESLTLPAELILLSLDVSLEWNCLRELRLEGYWPDRAELSLHSVLLNLPNLRVLSLRHEAALPTKRDPIVPADILASTSDIFLPELREFEVATLVRGDCVLSLLPPGLEKLSIIDYPECFDYRYPSNIRRASEFLGMLAGVYFPAATQVPNGRIRPYFPSPPRRRISVLAHFENTPLHGSKHGRQMEPSGAPNPCRLQIFGLFTSTERVPDATAVLEGSSCIRHRTRLSKPT